MTDTTAAAAAASIAIPAAPPAPAVATRKTAQPFQFTGRAGEYFRIWIVNLFLTVVTLGIYSAWAKVRRRRYFYGHTWLAGTNFEYHGDPKAILRGRLIAVALFLAYTLVGHFSPRAAAALALAAIPFVPWLLLRSFKFNAVNSSYRNVRFGFEGTYGAFLAAIAPVVIFPLATVIFGQYDPNGRRAPTSTELVGIFLPVAVFMLAYPWMSGRLHLLRANGSWFGAAPFHCGASIPQFYGLYFIAAVIAFLTGVVLFTPIGILAATGNPMAMVALVPIAYLGVFALSFGYTQSRLANIVFNDTTLDGTVRFVSRLKARKLASLYVTNLLAIVCTVGLAIPWAAIRVARVRAEALAVEAPGGLEHFLADTVAHVGATGEEVGEVFDFDVAL